MVIYVVKAAFVPFSATGEKPAIARVARLCGVSPCPVPDTATALPKQARYQLRYTRIFTSPRYRAGAADSRIALLLYNRFPTYASILCVKQAQIVHRLFYKAEFEAVIMYS